MYIKFKDGDSDFRPIKGPIKYPYWCTGQKSDSFVIVAYADSIEQIEELWPEAYNIEANEVQEIVFTTRFQKPEWYK